MPKYNLNIERLCTAVDYARQSLEVFRKNRLELIKQFAGNHYSDDSEQKRVVVNLISQYVSVVGRNLIAKNPRVMLSTFKRDQKATASVMQTWVNRELERMNIASILQRWVTDALFSIGILKCALATPADAAVKAWNLQAGMPFLSTVSLDDWAHDVHAKDPEEFAWMGHRFRAPLEVIKESKLYDAKARKRLVASSNAPYNHQGDEKASMIGKGYESGMTEEFEDMVDLWEIYVPRHRAILTIADDDICGYSGDAMVLREQSWIGPDSGPYHLLGMGSVPDNPMPKAPLQDLLDLHLAANRAYRKMVRMTDRIKDVTGFDGTNMEDGARLRDADDGDVIALKRPEGLKQIVTGAAGLQVVMASAIALKDLFNLMGGNLELVGGLGPQSKTLGQDRMLNENSSRGISDMQERTISGVAQAIKGLCWFYHHHPKKVMEAPHAVPGMPKEQIVRRRGPEEREKIPFEDLDIRVDPYSLQYQTPETRMAKLNSIIQGIVAPFMPLLQQQGKAFDIDVYLRKAGEYLDQPDLNEIITISEPPDAQQPGAPEEMKKPPTSERRYVRENVSSQTNKGTNANAVMSLMGKNPGGAPGQGAGP